MSGYNDLYEYGRTIKLLVLGDSGAGKSCLLLRFADNTFNPSFTTTIGIDFRTKVVNLGEEKVRLQIWDTAGQERYRAITKAQYRGAEGVVLVYDVTDEKSFGNVSDWKACIDKNAPTGIKTILVGNKCDLKGKRVVDKQSGRNLAKKYGIEFLETSAKSGENVNTVFHNITKSILDGDDLESTSNNNNNAIDLNNTPVSSRGCGCKQN